MPSKRTHFKLASLWLFVPIAGLTELALNFYFSHRAPSVEDWQHVKREVASLKRADDLILIAPEWAEPLARYAFGDELMPIRDLARADASGYRRAVEVAELGAVAPEIASWPLESERKSGPFLLRVRKNPAYEAAFAITDHAAPPELEVFESDDGRDEPCSYSTHAPTSAGSLLGHPTFPRERFICGRDPSNFVGTTIIDDQDFRPRRCLWANPRAGDSVKLRFSGVPVSNRIHGYVGLPYFTFRGHGWPAVTLSASVQGEAVGSYSHLPERGFRAFEFDTSRFKGNVGSVQFEVRVALPSEAQVCFYADARD